MTQFTRLGRLAAGALALAGWIGLGLYVVAEAAAQKGDWLKALWVNVGFLTDLTNLLLAVVMTGVALAVKPLARPHVVGWAVAAIATVGVGFWLIGGRLIWGKSEAQDILLHGVTPLAGVLFWLVFAPKGALIWKRALLWLVWPIGYFAYALIRGALTGEYAYSFLDPAKTSTGEIAGTVGMIVTLYAALTALLLVLDRVMGKRGQITAACPS